jgi:hypothetical protein
MALTLEQKIDLLATLGPGHWRPMLVCEDGRVVRDLNVYVSPLDNNALRQKVAHMNGAEIQVRKE